MQHIKPGEVVLRIPLHVALTDHVGDKESNKLIYDGAPWAVRLACKILREQAKGSQSPYHPYLQVQPTLALIQFVAYRIVLIVVVLSNSYFCKTVTTTILTANTQCNMLLPIATTSAMILKQQQ